VERHRIRRFLTVVNPALVELFVRSELGYSSQYQTLLDETYIALLDEYPENVLSLHISLMMHRNEFPFDALTVAFQLFDFQADEDLLAMLEFPFYDDLTPMDDHMWDNDNPLNLKSHLTALREFLKDPKRSKHHNFQQTAPEVYSKALLLCFKYLQESIIDDNCSIKETWLGECRCGRHDDIRIVGEPDTGEPNNKYCTQDEDMIGSLEYFCDVPAGEMHGVQNSEQDMALWRSGWRVKGYRVVSSIEISWWSKLCCC